MGILDSIMGGLVSTGGGLIRDAMNNRFQRQQNELTMEREDTAVQRRAADMEAAGFNPVLAAGNPASSQALPGMRMNTNVGESALQGAMAGVNVAQSQAQLDLTRQKVRQEKVTADIMNGSTGAGGTVMSYTEMELKKKYNAAIVGQYEADEKRALYAKGVPFQRAERSRLENQFFIDNAQEILQIELQMQREGRDQAEIETAVKKLAKRWWKSDRVFSYISSLTGSAAHVGAAASGGASAALNRARRLAPSEY